MSSDGQYFRAGAGAVVLDGSGRVLALERSDRAGAWQLPQGGLATTEEPHQAVLRELAEETGLGSERLRLLRRLPQPLAYELPPEARSEKTGRGQVNYWFVFRLEDAEDGSFGPLGREFSSGRWMPMEQLVEQVVDFRQPVYRALLRFLNEHRLRPEVTAGPREPSSSRASGS